MPAELRYDADVVVAGSGLAGICAALELAQRGKRVVICERSDRAGGLARDAFGGIFVAGTPEQRRSGVKDNAELALRDWLRYGELEPDALWPRRWAEAYVHRSLEDVRGWLRRYGVKFFPVVHWVERGLSVPGNSVPRFHLVWGTGRWLTTALLDALRRPPNDQRVRILLEHRVVELLTDQGRVTGCTGEHRGVPFTARADAVILAAGGIAGNLDLVRQHWDPALGRPPAYLLNGAHPHADGALHATAARLGARVTHLEQMWHYAAGVHHWQPKHALHGLSLVPPKSALWVGYDGRRLGPPSLVTAYDTRYLVEAVAKQPKAVSWQILNQRIAHREFAVSGAEFNAAIRERKPLAFVLGLLRGSVQLVAQFVAHCPDFVTAASVSELAARMNALAGVNDIDPTVLEGEVRSYDAAIRLGARSTDDQVQRILQARRYRGDRIRTCALARIDDPAARPLIAIREHLITRKSLGGLQTDLQSRVLGCNGEPIPGLYAAGEAAGFGGGGIHGKRSLEGTFLGGCILTGRIAGQAAGS